MFTSLEGFPNNTQNSTQILDVPDNYDGLTITQLLNTFPDCPPVPGDINPLQNEMVLHNGEVLPPSSKTLVIYSTRVFLIFNVNTRQHDGCWA